MDALLKKLTIAIPVYNDVKYIGHTIESCLTEAGQIILCDNASTDGSSEVCAAYAREHPHVTHIRHAENLGAMENFRQPLFDCKTEYFCWVGSHDLLEKNYALPVLETMEQEKDAVLGVGTIQHINESGDNLRRVTKSRWAHRSRNKKPLDRVAACVANLKDCFMIYGIFRTKALQKLWIERPILGHDRVILTRAAAMGKILYVPESIFYARDFPASRNSAEDQQRRTAELVRSGEKPLKHSLLDRHLGMIDVVMGLVKDEKDLKKALPIIGKINRRYVNRRHYQRLRAAAIVTAVMLVGLLLWYCIP